MNIPEEIKEMTNELFKQFDNDQELSRAYADNIYFKRNKWKKEEHKKEFLQIAKNAIQFKKDQKWETNTGSYFPESEIFRLVYLGHHKVFKHLIYVEINDENTKPVIVDLFDEFKGINLRDTIHIKNYIENNYFKDLECNLKDEV